MGRRGTTSVPLTGEPGLELGPPDNVLRLTAITACRQASVGPLNPISPSSPRRRLRTVQRNMSEHHLGCTWR